MGFFSLRTNVPNGETYRGNNQKLNSAHILRLGRPWCQTNHDILRLAEYRFIYEKINNNRIPSKCRFWCSKFKKNLEASRPKMRHSRPIKITTKSLTKAGSDSRSDYGSDQTGIFAFGAELLFLGKSCFNNDTGG